jgi:hypothetical protein
MLFYTFSLSLSPDGGVLEYQDFTSVLLFDSSRDSSHDKRALLIFASIHSLPSVVYHIGILDTEA